MALRIGGESPLIGYGLSMPVECPAGTTAAAPVTAGELFTLDGTTSADGTAQKLVALTAGDKTSTKVFLMALENGTSATQVITCQVITGQAVQIRRLAYTGAAPTLGHSVAVSAANVRKVVDAAWARGDGYITYVDTGASEVEVLI